MQPLITTSWDDGHEADFHLAELLHKYNLKATFYIPKANAERKVMQEAQVRELSKHFEIGAHTMQHVRLHKLSHAEIFHEVAGSYQWVGDVTGIAPVSFCFPGGKYNRQAIQQAYACGFKVLRTTELLSTMGTALHGMTPTTLQLFPHQRTTYLTHLIKRRKWGNLVHWLRASGSSSLEKLTEHYIAKILKHGGSFHLWGHSWEIAENNLWEQLENIFKLLSNRAEFTYIENKDILKY